jgi:hypothetical protein
MQASFRKSLIAFCLVAGVLVSACSKEKPPKRTGSELAAAADAIKPKKTVPELLAGKGDSFPIPHEQLEKDRWLARLGIFLQDGPSAEACGADVPSDVCKRSMDKAFKSLGNCPVRASVTGTLKPYDAAARALPVELSNTQITNEGLVWLEEDVFVKWPGAARAVLRDASVDPCKADPKQTEASYSLAALKLAVDAEDAKEAAEKIKAAATIDVLYVLDKKAAAGPFACGTTLPKSQAVGEVVAWRMKPALGWHSIGGNAWTPPKECKSARMFFGMQK